MFWLKWAALSAFCTVCIFTFATPAHSSFRILFFDLGKTEASFVSFSNGRNCLINTGRRYPNDQAFWIVRPFLMASGFRTLDHVLLTSSDSAHAGGLQTLTKYFQISNLFIAPQLSVEKSEISFGPDSSIELLAASHGKPLVFQIRQGEVSALYFTSTQAKAFELLLKKPVFSYDIVFFPQHDYGIGDAEEIFLKRTRPRFIVSNQREGLSELKAELESIVSSELFFIQNLGAVEFRLLKEGWNWQNFKT